MAPRNLFASAKKSEAGFGELGHHVWEELWLDEGLSVRGLRVRAGSARGIACVPGSPPGRHVESDTLIGRRR
jgi:hypothetical protein